MDGGGWENHSLSGIYYSGSVFINNSLSLMYVLIDRYFVVVGDGVSKSPDKDITISVHFLCDLTGLSKYYMHKVILCSGVNLELKLRGNFFERKKRLYTIMKI